jgi:DNA-binding response OmpR family regulator
VPGSKRILIVDDDSQIRRVVRICLESRAHEIAEAGDGAMALEMIEPFAPELMLLDLSLPVMDGLTVLAELRTSIPQPLPSVIVMTAHGSVRAALLSVRLGAADFLEKPFTPTELQQSVSSVLDDPAACNNGANPNGPDALLGVREALRRGKFYTAEAALSKAANTVNDHDPRYLNLVGVLHEAHGRLEAARDLYARAFNLDSTCAAAERNLKRLAQIKQHGSSLMEIALGDESDLHTANPTDTDATTRRIRAMLDQTAPPS